MLMHACIVGRVIVVTSSLHEKGKLDFNAIRNFDFPATENLYADSKLANVYFAHELAKRLSNKVALLGAVATKLVNNHDF